MSRPNGSSFRLEADLLWLRALVAIADTGSFSTAAKQVGRTQSAISLQIAKLEDRLQSRLLERTSRSVRPTAAGEVLISYARRMLALADEAALALSAPAVAQTLRVGFADYLAPRHLHDLLARFNRAHPKVVLDLRLGRGTELNDALEGGELDVVICGPENEGGRVLLHEPLIWVGRPGAAPSDALPLVLMQAPCSYRRAAIEAMAAYAGPWRVAVEANSVQAVQSAVAAGLGISVLPRSAVPKDQLVLKTGYPSLPETAIIAFSSSSKARLLADRFIDFLEQELAA